MSRYLIRFHEEFQQLLSSRLPGPERSFAPRAALLPARVVGYVSTQFGAGFEYFEAPTLRVETERSSRRIEDLFTGPPSEVRDLPTMIRVAGSDIEISGLTLEGGFPFRLATTSASVRFRDVAFRVGQWNRTVRFAELFGDRSAAFWSESNATTRARDEIVAALFLVSAANKQGVAVAEYLNTFKERTVLFLGSFTPEGKMRLARLKAALAERGYLPILLDDVPDPLDYDLRQKFVAVAAVCRFVVFEDSEPSGHVAELVLAEQQRLYTIVMRESGLQSSFMTRGMQITSDLIREFTYTAAALDSAVMTALTWVEPAIAQRRAALSTAYPWRKPGEPATT